MIRLLKKGEEKQLEDLQKKALRIIVGHKKTYEECLKICGIITLKDRRLDLVDKFIKKTVNNPRYFDWFPKKEKSSHDIREEKVYLEKFARSNRLYRNPLYFYQRRLNQIL